MFWVVISTLVVIAMWGAAAVTALRAARNARTAQGAIGWVVFLLSAPIVALPVYLVFGSFRFKGYHHPRVDLFSNVKIPRSDSEGSATRDPGVSLAPFEAVAGLPTTQGNECKLLINGEECFEAILSEIDKAQDYILVQYYIVRADGLGLRLQKHLMQAVKRGVPVWFMIDNIGSHSLPQEYLNSLEEAGVNLVDPASSRGPRHRFHLNFRNHRKTVIVDGRIGFTGGLNMGDEYLGLDPSFGPWRDTHLRLCGPAVQQLQLSFVEDWQWKTDEPIWELMCWTPVPGRDNRRVLIVATGPTDQIADGSMLFFSSISASTERLWIATPYFVPDQDVLAALTHAALRGVDVRLLLPEGIDHYLTWLAAFSFIDDLRRVGVRFFRYQPGFMHQKVLLIDDTVAGVGTTNLDNRSFRLNFETMAMMFDREMAHQVEKMLLKDLEAAREVDKALEDQPWNIQLFSPMARLLAPIL